METWINDTVFVSNISNWLAESRFVQVDCRSVQNEVVLYYITAVVIFSVQL